jgi:hypothetical protein
MSEQLSAEQCDCCESRGPGCCLWDTLETLTRERDLALEQAKLNAQTVMRQAHVIRKLERRLVVERTQE